MVCVYSTTGQPRGSSSEHAGVVSLTARMPRITGWDEQGHWRPQKVASQAHRTTDQLVHLPTDAKRGGWLTHSFRIET